MATAQDLIKDALKELGVMGVADALDADVGAFGLGKLNRILDNLNAEKAGLYAEQIAAFTLTPALQPHTIGASGATWTATAPVAILGANLILSGGSREPITVRDAAWWLSLSDPTLSGDPTDLRYEPSPWPKGSVYLWPVPSTAYQVELYTRIPLAAMVLTTTFAMPPGYQDAITLTLAEDLAGPMGTQIAPDLRRKAFAARARIQANNARTPALSTVDAGMPSRSSDWFDYRTRGSR